MEKKRIRKRLSVLIFELLIYVAFLTAYVFFGLKFLSEPMYILFNTNLTTYAVVVVLLILTQAIMLDFVVSILLKSMGIFKNIE